MKRKKGKPLTLMRAYQVLDQEDRVICLLHLKRCGYGPSDLHLGMLPFISIQNTLTALKRTTDALVLTDGTPSRRLFSLQDKLWKVMEMQKLPKIRHVAETQGGLWLDNGKVARIFGSNPERGRPFRWLGVKKVSVGVKWSLPKKDYVVDDDVLVTPTVALKNIFKNYWQVLVEDKYRAQVEEWLLDHAR